MANKFSALLCLGKLRSIKTSLPIETSTRFLKPGGEVFIIIIIKSSFIPPAVNFRGRLLGTSTLVRVWFFYIPLFEIR